MIKSIRVKQFKAIADAEISLSPLHLLIGLSRSCRYSIASRKGV